MKNNLRKLAWIIVSAMIGSSILILLLWLARITGLTTGNDGNAISVLGGIMGAIFTAGGIIVALVAVLSQIQLQDRVKQEIDGARQVLREDFNNVLRKEFEQEIHRQVDGLLSFFSSHKCGRLGASRENHLSSPSIISRVRRCSPFSWCKHSPADRNLFLRLIFTRI